METSLRNGRPKKWWHDAIIYEIYVRSFKDSNGDGIGDLQGIIEKLDYLKNLGVDAIWLTPIFPSPLYDCGYDISDYRSIDPDYGTMDDFKELIKEAHQRDIKVILDLVLNHTSSEHEWFKEARKSKDNPKHDWYVWAEGRDGGPPNNWGSVFGDSSWEYNEQTGEYYYHAFLPQQPDLNWNNPEVKEEMFDTVRFWLDMGVDGFRLDAINFLMEDPKLKDNPVCNGEQQHLYDRDQESTHEILKELRKVIDEYDDRMLVGEIFPGKPGQSQRYYGENDNELHLAFNFLPIKLADQSEFFSIGNFDAVSLRKELKEWDETLKKNNCWPTVVMGNHDQPRQYNNFGAYVSDQYKDRMAKLIAGYTIFNKGTTFLYYGEEIGMENLDFLNIEDYRDNSGTWFYYYMLEQGNDHREAIKKANEVGRDKCRTPMQWDDTKNGGFTVSDKTWIKMNPIYVNKNAKLQEKDPHSILNFYKEAIKIYKRNEVLKAGDYQWIDDNHEDYLAFYRCLGNKKVLIVMNLSEKEHRIKVNNKLKLLFSNADRQEEFFEGVINIKPVEFFVAEERC